jgi:hypothetical protein
VRSETGNPIAANPRTIAAATSQIVEPWTAASRSTPTPPACRRSPSTAAASGFHNAADLPSVVDPGVLTREAAGYRGSVDAITAQPAGAVRAANSAAAPYAVGFSADSRAPVNPVFGAAGVGGQPVMSGPGLW